MNKNTNFKKNTKKKKDDKLEKLKIISILVKLQSPLKVKSNIIVINTNKTKMAPKYKSNNKQGKNSKPK